MAKSSTTLSLRKTAKVLGVVGPVFKEHDLLVGGMLTTTDVADVSEFEFKFVARNNLLPYILSKKFRFEKNFRRTKEFRCKTAKLIYFSLLFCGSQSIRS